MLGGLAFSAGLLASIALILLAAPAASSRSVALAVGAAILGLAAPLIRPRLAFSVLIISAGFLPGLPRLWRDFSALHVFLVLAAASAGAHLAGTLWKGEPLALDGRVWKWGGGFLAVAFVSALSSGIRGSSLFFLLRGGVDPLIVNSLGMLARDRWIEAAELFIVLACLLPLTDAGLRLYGSEPAALQKIALSAVLVASLGGVLGKFVPQEAGSYWVTAERVSGLMTDPNALGIGLALLLPLAVPGLFSGTALLRGVTVVSLLVAAWALEVSGSRSGLMLLLVAALAGGVAAYRRGGRARTVVLVSGSALLVFGAAALVFLPRSERIAAGGLVSRLGAALNQGSLAEISNSRSMYWAAAWDSIRREPLSGCGLAGFPYEFPFWFERRFGPARFTDNTTNGFLDVVAECGLPALFLAAFAVWPVLTAARRSIGCPASAPAVAAGGALLGFLVILLWGSHIRNPEVAIWMIVPVVVLSPRSSETPPGAGVAGSRRIYSVLVGAGILGSLLATAQTRDAAWAFRVQPWAGLHGGGQEALMDGVPRWTGRSLFRRVGPGEKSVRLGFKNQRPDGRSVLGRIDVDGVEAGAVALSAGEERWFRVEPLPDGAEAVRVRFSPTFVPRELTGSPDSRELGVVALPPGERRGR